MDKLLTEEDMQSISKYLSLLNENVTPEEKGTEIGFLKDMASLAVELRAVPDKSDLNNQIYGKLRELNADFKPEDSAGVSFLEHIKETIKEPSLGKSRPSNYQIYRELFSRTLCRFIEKKESRCRFTVDELKEVNC